MGQINPLGLTEAQFKTYNQLRCPFCSMQLGFGDDILAKEVIDCPSCHGKFAYDDGFIERIVNIPVTFHFVWSLRLGMFQVGSATFKLGEIVNIKFKKPFFKVSGVFLVDAQGKFHDMIETDDYLIACVSLTNEGFQIVSSEKKPTATRQVSLNWSASGAESGTKIPVWHIFLQNTIDLLAKGEYAAVIVMAMMTFDSYLDGLLVEKLCSKHSLPEDFVNRLVMSPKFGRGDFLGYWLKNLFGKSFTKDCTYNDELKKFADMRLAIVHPTPKGFDESKLDFQSAQRCIEVTTKSIQWLSHLKLGILST
jgi:hypothetical protein